MLSATFAVLLMSPFLLLRMSERRRLFSQAAHSG